MLALLFPMLIIRTVVATNAKNSDFNTMTLTALTPSLGHTQTGTNIFIKAIKASIICASVKATIKSWPVHVSDYIVDFE